MKNLLITKTVLFLTCLLMVACNSSATIPKKITILYDVTDPLIRKPLLSDVLAFSNLDENIWQAITIHIETISNLNSSEHWDIVLPEENHAFVSKRIREMEVSNFKKKILKRFTYLDSIGNYSLDHSIIYESIANAANQLCKSPDCECYLLVYSNLMENSVVNFHCNKTFELLKNKPDTIKKVLIPEAKIGNLRNLKIYLLFKAHDYEENGRYKVASRFFTSILTEKSASVQLELP